MRINRFIASFSVIFLLGFSVKPQNLNTNTVKEEKTKIDIEILDVNKDIKNTSKKEEKDSILKAFNQETMLSKNEFLKLGEKQAKREKLRKEQEKAFEKLISSAQEALRKKEDNRIIIVSKTTFQKLKDEELLFVKDSTCSKKRFLSKKCLKWEYQYFLVDNKGEKKKL